MGSFEDEIRKKLSDRDYTPDAGLWDKLSEQLDSIPTSTPFEENIRSTFEEGEIPKPDNAWDQFESKQNLNTKFDDAVKSKFENKSYNYNKLHWEKQADLIHHSNLTKFEKIIQSVFRGKKIQYNHQHWVALEKMLNNTKQKWMYRSVAAALLLLFGSGSAIYFSGSNEKPTIGNNNVNNSKAFTSKSSNIDDQIIRDNRNNAVFFDSGTANNDKLLKGEKYLQDLAFKSKNTSENKYGNTKSPNKHNGSQHILQSIEKQTKGNTFSNLSIGYKNQEYCNTLDLNINFDLPKGKKQPERPLHHGARFQLNFWDNPAVTGLYAQNHFSSTYKNGWEKTLTDDHQKEYSFIQPLHTIVGYEHQFKNSPWSAGGYFSYNLNNNWNIREYGASVSYTKELLKDLKIRLGGSAEFNSTNLAVNKLTLRQRAINSDFIFTTDLGKLKAKTESSIHYNTGVMINHPKYFASFSLNDISKTQLKNDNESVNTVQEAIVGIHANLFQRLDISPIFKYRKDVFEYYSPGMAITYNNKVFAFFSYENLSNYNTSLGYCWRDKLRITSTFSLAALTDLQKDQLNLNNFNERKGFIEFGINYIIK